MLEVYIIFNTFAPNSIIYFIIRTISFETINDLYVSKFIASSFCINFGFDSNSSINSLTR